MEIHHHAHTARKKWTHYFWEFFMLFLAVTLGFFVENRREHYIEHKRAKVYAAAMVTNLQQDTAELKAIIYRGTYATAYLDTFLMMTIQEDPEKIPSGKLYWYGLWGGYLRGFQPNDASFQQMKSSGSLRFFSSSLQMQISNYDQLLRSMQMLNQIDQPVYLEVRKLRAKIFDYRYNNEANNVVRQAVYTTFNQAMIDSFLLSGPPLLTRDKVVFNEYVELCRSRSLRQQLVNATEALKIATTIIELLKEEFHIK